MITLWKRLTAYSISMQLHLLILRLDLDDDIVIGGGGCKAYARPVRNGQRTAKRSCCKLCHDLSVGPAAVSAVFIGE